MERKWLRRKKWTCLTWWINPWLSESSPSETRSTWISKSESEESCGVSNLGNQSINHPTIYPSTNQPNLVQCYMSVVQLFIIQWQNQGWGSGQIRWFWPAGSVTYFFHPESTNLSFKWWFIRSNLMPTYLKNIYFGLHFELRSDPEPDLDFCSCWARSGSEDFFWILISGKTISLTKCIIA